MQTQTQLIEACFAASPNVRYVAAYLDGALELRSRADLLLLGSNESDRYEEIIVNPTLLKLLTQRANIDCGGLGYVIVRYGTFFAFIHPLANGHVTVSFELHTKLDDEIPKMSEVIARIAG